ncbi:hypothetical protein GCM10028805_46590 [Spirosoma harenae]
MNTLYMLLLGMLAKSPVQAQVRIDSLRTPSNQANVVRNVFPEYDQEIMYYGKHNQYFTVRIFRKNGDLFRQDSYTLLPKTLPNGWPLDSLDRIVHHGPTKIMYPSGKVYVSCEYNEGALDGPFMVLYEDGSIKRREFYKRGRLKKSQCYTTDGSAQKCELFYQTAQFLGDPKALETYLTQKLGSVLDGERVRKVAATLIINEIGQVVRVNVAVNTSTLAQQQVQAVGSYVQQVIRNMPEWTPEKLNWKPAVNDGVSTTSSCVLSVFRYYGAIKYNLTYQM